MTVAPGQIELDAGRLRVLVITEDDPLYVIKFFEEFFPRHPRDVIEIVGVTVQAAFHEPLTKTASRMWNFYGPVDFVRLGLAFAMAKASRRSIGRLVAQHGLPIVDAPASVNDPSYVETVRSLRPDVIMSVAAPEIFRKDLLGAATKRCVNIHSGRLPRYRGMMPNFWQLLHGEPHATVTVHEMVAKLDAGAVLGTLEVPIRERDSLHRLIVETKRRGADLMIDVLRQIASGTDAPMSLDMSDAGYYSFPKPDDVRALRKRGHRML